MLSLRDIVSSYPQSIQAKPFPYPLDTSFASQAKQLQKQPHSVQKIWTTSPSIDNLPLYAHPPFIFFFKPHHWQDIFDNIALMILGTNTKTHKEKLFVQV